MTTAAKTPAMIFIIFGDFFIFCGKTRLSILVASQL